MEIKKSIVSAKVTFADVKNEIWLACYNWAQVPQHFSEMPIQQSWFQVHLHKRKISNFESTGSLTRLLQNNSYLIWGTFLWLYGIVLLKCANIIIELYSICLSKEQKIETHLGKLMTIWKSIILKIDNIYWQERWPHKCQRCILLFV